MGDEERKYREARPKMIKRIVEQSRGQISSEKASRTVERLMERNQRGKVRKK